MSPDRLALADPDDPQPGDCLAVELDAHALSDAQMTQSAAEEDLAVKPALDAVVEQDTAEPGLLVEPVDAGLHAATLVAARSGSRPGRSV